MDQRLALGGGAGRLHRLLRSELVSPALAIVACLVGAIEAKVGVISGAKVVCMQGAGLDVTILASDWEKLRPFLESDYFSDSVYPTFSGYGYQSIEELVTEGSPYSLLYQRVYGKLLELFQDEYENLERI